MTQFAQGLHYRHSFSFCLHFLTYFGREYLAATSDFSAATCDFVTSTFDSIEIASLT